VVFPLRECEFYVVFFDGYFLTGQHNHFFNSLDLIYNNQNSVMKKLTKMLLLVLGTATFMLAPGFSYAQETVKVKGRVVEAKDKTPLAGATIKQVNGNKSVVADTEGKFEIDLPAKSKITVSMVGHAPQTINASGKEMVIELEIGNGNLDEVVVIGYTAVKRELLTGSVANIKMKDADREVPTTNVGNLLAGRVAGLDVSTPSGVPGSAPGLSVRTYLSYNRDGATRPGILYVIDGKISGQGDFNNLSPNEIDNISVLKDAATTAVYGSRAAGGVIVVTTKRGKSGKPVISYGFNTGYDKRANGVELTSAVEQGKIFSTIYGPTHPAYWQQSDYDYFNQHDFGGGYGWGFSLIDDVFRDPFTKTHNLSITGGSEKVKYFVGGSYVNQQGFLKGLDYDKYNMRANITADLTKDINIFAGFGLNNNKTEQNSWGGGNADDLYNKLRVWQPWYPTFSKSGAPVDYYWIGNMAAEVQGLGGYRKFDYLKPVITLSGTYKVPYIEGLSFKTSFIKSYTNSRFKSFRKLYYMTRLKVISNLIWDLDDANALGKYPSAGMGPENLTQEARWSNDQQLNMQLNYDRAFGKHHISGYLGYERAEINTGGMLAQVRNFPIYTTDQWWATSTAPTDDDVSKNTGYSETSDGRKSWFGQLFYDYEGKYLANFTYRYDGSMKFAPDKRWGFFPGGSVGWIVSKENFFHVKGIDLLKVRASVGLSGNDAPGGWQWQATYRQGSSFWLGTNAAQNLGITYRGVVNPNITWEKHLNKNIAVDINFLKHFNATAEYWRNDVSDILAPRIASVPATFSLPLPDENYGKTKAWGVDLSLGYGNRFGQVLFNTTVNLSYGDGKFVEKDQNITYPYDNELNQSFSRIIGYTVDRMLRTEAEATAFMQANPNYKFAGVVPKAGNFVYKDLSGPDGKPDGIVDRWDRSILEKRNIPVVLGWNLNAEWKGFSIAATFNGRVGAQKSYNDLAGGVEWNRNWRDWATDSWTPERTNATLPGKVWSYDSPEYARNTAFSNFWYASGSFLRLKFLTVSYSIPAKLYQKFGISNIKFYASGSNLFVISKFNNKYYDPELGSGFAFPIIKSYNAGFNVSF